MTQEPLPADVAAKYPEHAKLRNAHARAEICKQFLAFIQEDEELALVDRDDTDVEYAYSDDLRTKLIFKFLEIDYDAFYKEKDVMLGVLIIPAELDVEVTAGMLGMVDVSVTPEQVATWTREQRAAADDWAAKTHLHASDNDDVVVPPKPEFLNQYPKMEPFEPADMLEPR